jgi:vanillate O-demethylase monooxygenase subunit
MNAIARNLAGEIPAPRNAWYVVAFSDEVGEKPFARHILGSRVVFYRTADGQAVMLDDYCAHRAMALSDGKRVAGDRIQCPYHGLEYGPDGGCALVPSQDQIPRQMKVRSYPLVEKWKWIWAWMGDAEGADPALIPDHDEFGLGDHDGFRKIKRFVMQIGGNFQLLHENLLDVSHITFLHEGSFDSGGIAKTPPETEVTEDTIRIGRKISEVMTGNYARIFEFPDGSHVDRELVSKTWVPSLNVVSNYFWPAGSNNSKPMIRHAPFAITPETETSCHYFVAASANYGEEPSEEALAIQNAAVMDIFLTDKMAIESIQKAYSTLRSPPDVSVRADEAALRFRRILAQQAARETAAE